MRELYSDLDITSILKRFHRRLHFIQTSHALKFYFGINISSVYYSGKKQTQLFIFFTYKHLGPRNLEKQW